MRPLAWALLTVVVINSSTDKAFGQTFTATRAIDETKCQRFLFSNKCITVETDRIHWTFTQAKLGYYVFGRTWATASHCTRVEVTESKCLRSIFISTDPEWNRLLWGQAGTFLRWLGTLDGSESGTRLKEPHDVAWDPADTWTLADDRVFIVDTENNRVVVYQVSVDPVGGTMSKTYLSSFGTYGQGPTQFSRPQGIFVRSTNYYAGLLGAEVYISDTENHRVSLWYYDTNSPTVPDAAPQATARSTPISGSEFIGLSQDFYGDLIVSDRARNVLVKFTRLGLQHLKTYGGTQSWSTGNFNKPTDAEVIYNYWQDSWGFLIKEALPYV